MFARRLTLCIFFSLMVSTLTGGCSSHPGWVFRLPEAGSKVPAATDNPARILPGTWVRLVESRYSVANPELYWKAREWIEITRLEPEKIEESKLAYEKFQLYADYYRGELRRRAYRERGNIKRDGSWLLFESREAHAWSEKRKIKEGEKKAFEASRRLLLPGFEEPEVKKGARSVSMGPLRYFLSHETRGTAEQETLRRLHYLTPLVYERFGRLFEHGIYEGCSDPCDPNSKIFRAGLRRYNVNSFHRHGYLRREVRTPAGGL